MDNEYKDVRLQKSGNLRELGVSPYALRTPEHSSCAELRKLFEAYEQREKTQEEKPEEGFPQGAVAGRLLSLRAMGKKVCFADLWDESGRLQLYLGKEALGEEQWEIYRNLDLGDIVWASGELRKTKTGEVSLFVTELRFLTKALAVPPLEKSGGLKDKETRQRKRYMDLLASPEKRQIFRLRSKVLHEMRQFLTELEYMEVETPMMHSIAGGARARPFITHHHALDMDLYLRIAPELYLKRLLVAGFERVFEINRSFRNEGIDHTHNPEFTMLELYEAYSDYHGMMELTESLFIHLLSKIPAEAGSSQGLSRSWRGEVIDFSPPFKRAPYAQLFKEKLGIDVYDEAAVAAKIKELPRGKELLSLGHWKRADKLFDEFVQPGLINPTFVIDYPTPLCPLAKPCEDKPEISERFELFIKGLEFANAFSELNDPVEQQKRFEEQVKAAHEEQDLEGLQEVDYDYVEALEFGMPPAGGLGIGIDRLVMLLSDQESIREVILFPHLRREEEHRQKDEG